MIDNRFSLVPDPRPDYKHLFHLQFTVVLPPERYYANESSSLILEEGRKQYPELIFGYAGDYTAKFSDGQYAMCVQCKVKNSYLEELVFSLPLELDTIMAGVCNFKRAVPPIYFTIHPEEISTITPEDFLEIVENMYGGMGLSLRVRAVSWKFDRVDFGEAVYLITPTDYDYI